MGIIDAFLERRRQNIVALEQRSVGTTLVPFHANRPTWLPSTIDTYDAGAYRKVALVFRCTQYIANAAGDAKLRVYAEKNGDQVADNTHALRQLLVRPNDNMGETRFMSFVAMLMTVTGFALIEKERNVMGGVMRLWPLRSDWARPIRREDGTTDWEYTVPGRQPVILEAEDVIATSYADTPDFSPTGIGPLQAILREVGITSAMTDFLKVFMDRGAMPLYVMMPSDDPKASAQWSKPETKAAFVDAFRQRYGGLPRAVDPMPLVGIKDIKPLGFNFDELAYPELNKMADARICTGFGIPPILVGTEVGLERSTFSNTAEARRSFYEDTMRYFWVRLDDAFTRQLLPDFETRPGYELAFDTSDLPALRDDEDASWKRAVEGFRVGMISRHTAQLEAGVTAHGADEFLVPMNAVPLPNAQRSNGYTAYVEGGTTPLRALPLAHDPKAPRFISRDGGRYINEVRLSPAERRRRAAIIATNRQAMGKLAGLLRPEVARFLDGQRARVLTSVPAEARALDDIVSLGTRRLWETSADDYRATLGRPIATKAVDGLDWDTEDAMLGALLAAWWPTVGETAFERAEAQLDTDLGWATGLYATQLARALEPRVRAINETTRRDIEELVIAALLAGRTLDELRGDMDHLFDTTYAGRDATIATTETTVAYGQASVLGFAAGGVRDVQVSDNPAHTEAYTGATDGLTCAQRHNLVVPIDRAMFHVQSDHPNGSASLVPVLTSPLGGAE